MNGRIDRGDRAVTVASYIIDSLIGKTGGFIAGVMVLNQLTKFLKVESFWNIFVSGAYLEVSETNYFIIRFLVSAIVAALIGDGIRKLSGIIFGRLPLIGRLF